MVIDGHKGCMSCRINKVYGLFFSRVPGNSPMDGVVLVTTFCPVADSFLD